jgi:hypothetical protein
MDIYSTKQRQDDLRLITICNHKLEDENITKSAEIQLLREHLERESSSRGSRTVSLRSIPSDCCPQCKGKDSQIDTLSRSVKELIDTHQRELKRLSQQ